MHIAQVTEQTLLLAGPGWLAGYNRKPTTGTGGGSFQTEHLSSPKKSQSLRLTMGDRLPSGVSRVGLHTFKTVLNFRGQLFLGVILLPLLSLKLREAFAPHF